jgi:HSP20 family protein
MSMERWNPFREIESMRQAMDRWMDERGFNNLGNSASNQNLSLAVDVHETENGYELNASLPGVKPEDVEISVNKDVVTIRGRTEQNEERQQGNYIYRERHAGSFQRAVRLPDQVNAEQVEASLEHGVLKVTLPRLQQATQRRIQVKSGANTGSQQISTGASPNSTSQNPASPTGAGNTTNSTTNADAATYAGTAPTTPQNSTTPQNKEGQTMTTERPEILNNLSSTQMDELERHASANDRQGFGYRTDSYGWDQQTTEQIWNYLTRRVTRDEVDRAFESPS